MQTSTSVGRTLSPFLDISERNFFPCGGRGGGGGGSCTCTQCTPCVRICAPGYNLVPNRQNIIAVFKGAPVFHFNNVSQLLYFDTRSY